MRKMFLIGIMAALALAPVAFADVIAPGIDVWETRNDGQTYTNITFPAGFFCPASPAFSTQVGMAGVPIATNPADVLGKSDTVIERLGSADVTSGDARVSAIIRAISFKGTAAINVPSCPCNPWTVRVLGDGTQPVSTVTIRRTSTGGGTFDSDIRINAHLILTCGTSQAHLNQSITFQASGAEWTNRPGSGGVSYPSPVSIDTNGDGTADLSVPGTSGFSPGWSPFPKPGCATAPCPVVIPHQVPTHAHFVFPPPQWCKSLTTAQRRAGKATATAVALACAQKEISPTVQPAEPIGTGVSGVN
ncbi:MAG: hypothetical protein ACJ75H_20980 [Thermoanaerobaculia bacterium]